MRFGRHWDWLYDKSGCLGVSRQMVPDSRSGCTEGCVVEVGQRPTAKKRIRVSAERSVIFHIENQPNFG